MLIDPCDTSTLPSTNQRIVHELITYPGTPLPHLAFKNASLKPIREFGLLEHELFRAPCLAPYNKCCTFLHHNPASVDWLY